MLAVFPLLMLLELNLPPAYLNIHQFVVSILVVHSEEKFSLPDIMRYSFLLLPLLCQFFLEICF